ncbi:MAG: methyltransferase domain-containing protein [Solirubrobacterales bacterium]
MAPHDWNAKDYDRTNAGIIALGAKVLDRLPLSGGETVLDAGAGTGAVSQLLAERLPDGHVIALDAAPQMVEFARERFAGADNVEVVQADLYDFDLGGRKVDAVLSTATFHWVKDHDALWRNLRGVMRDGAQLVAQCGGAGNIQSVLDVIEPLGQQEPYAQYVGGWDPHNFATPEETEQRMRAAGFSETRAWLEQTPVFPEDLGKHLREVILGAHAERMPAELFEQFASAADAALGERESVDYVRLNIDAVA